MHRNLRQLSHTLALDVSRHQQESGAACSLLVFTPYEDAVEAYHDALWQELAAIGTIFYGGSKHNIEGVSSTGKPFHVHMATVEGDMSHRQFQPVDLIYLDRRCTQNSSFMTHVLLRLQKKCPVALRVFDGDVPQQRPKLQAAAQPTRATSMFVNAMA